MHYDLDAAAPRELATQTCIIGAGAAGITMARRLLKAGQDVVLLESGSIDYEPATAALNEGENVGRDYYDLAHARLRFFGGTTAIWGGRCAELDDIDFAVRSWVPHSGWPITKAELAPYYRSASRLLGVPEDPLDKTLLTQSGISLPDFSPEILRIPLWSFDRKYNRFSFDACRDLVTHPRCTIVTHANVREIVADPSGRAVDHLDVQSLDGNRMRVRASQFVLAAGGIENPRLLLSSRSVLPDGIGNAYDQVGRYFMEHPHARGGRIVNGTAWALLKAFGKRHHFGRAILAPLIAPSARLQQAQGLLNTSLTIASRRPSGARDHIAMRTYYRLKHDLDPSKLGRTLWMRAKQATHVVLRYSEPLRPWVLNKTGTTELALVVRGEQAPNPLSRITLSDRTDAMGVPLPKLDWRMTALDTRSVAGLVQALGQECARLGIGTVEPAPWLSEPSAQWVTDLTISAHPIGGYHHMGTTRMGSDPRTSVTDQYGRVHGIANLFIAGSSLFPTSGWANPTLTIMALALRTADHIVERPRT